jgi:hypothetical protein
MLSVKPIVLFLTELNFAFIKQRVTVYKETKLGIPANKREPNSNTKQSNNSTPYQQLNKVTTNYYQSAKTNELQKAFYSST